MSYDDFEGHRVKVSELGAERYGVSFVHRGLQAERINGEPKEVPAVRVIVGQRGTIATFSRTEGHLPAIRDVVFQNEARRLVEALLIQKRLPTESLHSRKADDTTYHVLKRTEFPDPYHVVNQEGQVISQHPTQAEAIEALDAIFEGPQDE